MKIEELNRALESAVYHYKNTHLIDFKKYRALVEKIRNANVIISVNTDNPVVISTLQEYSYSFDAVDNKITVNTYFWYFRDFINPVLQKYNIKYTDQSTDRR